MQAVLDAVPNPVDANAEYNQRLTGYTAGLSDLSRYSLKHLMAHPADIERGSAGLSHTDIAGMRDK